MGHIFFCQTIRGGFDIYIASKMGKAPVKITVTDSLHLRGYALNYSVIVLSTLRGVSKFM